MFAHRAITANNLRQKPIMANNKDPQSKEQRTLAQTSPNTSKAEDSRKQKLINLAIIRQN